MPLYKCWPPGLEIAADLGVEALRAAGVQDPGPGGAELGRWQAIFVFAGEIAGALEAAAERREGPRQQRSKSKAGGPQRGWQ